MIKISQIHWQFYEEKHKQICKPNTFNKKFAKTLLSLSDTIAEISINVFNWPFKVVVPKVKQTL